MRRSISCWSRRCSSGTDADADADCASEDSDRSASSLAMARARLDCASWALLRHTFVWLERPSPRTSSWKPFLLRRLTVRKTSLPPSQEAAEGSLDRFEAVNSTVWFASRRLRML